MAGRALLFDAVRARRPGSIGPREPGALPEPPAPLVEGTWIVEDHLCVICLGRILVRVADTIEIDQHGLVTSSYRCSNCGAAKDASHSIARPPVHPPGCACGLMYATRNAGLRCTVNPDRSVLNPAEIIVKET